MEIEDLKILEKAVETAKAILTEARKEFAEQHTKLKIGDVVKVTNYSHNGKDMVVEKIFYSTGVWLDGVVAAGPVLKKDGTPSKYTGRHLELQVK